MIAIIRFPGSNCDDDACWAVSQLGGEAKLVWHRETRLEDADALILPGGFSYGDYLRSGAMAAHSPVMEAVREFAAKGGPVLGICNGFQVLTESGLLPGALARNSRPHFLCRNVQVRVERNDLAFTGGYRQGQVLELPVAHAEGSYFADPDTLAALDERRGVVFRYCDAHGGALAESPNGSVNSIAGIVNERGNVLGMMPHPERAVEGQLGGVDGVPLLSSLLNGLRAAAEAGSSYAEATSA